MICLTLRSTAPSRNFERLSEAYDQNGTTCLRDGTDILSRNPDLAPGLRVNNLHLGTASNA